MPPLPAEVVPVGVETTGVVAVVVVFGETEVVEEPLDTPGNPSAPSTDDVDSEPEAAPKKS
jgi:hypothetical protein